MNNNFYNKIWEITKEWKIEPFVFLWNLLTINISYLFFSLNIVGLVLYFMFDKNFTKKYIKKYILKNFLWGILFGSIVFIMWYGITFILMFDDAESLTSEDREFIFMKMVIITIFIKVVYSYILAKIYQKQKKLSYEEKFLKNENNFNLTN